MSTRFDKLRDCYWRMIGRYDESMRNGDHHQATRRILAASRILRWMGMEARKGVMEVRP